MYGLYRILDCEGDMQFNIFNILNSQKPHKIDGRKGELVFTQ